MEKIKSVSDLPLDFNNALIEIYDRRYRKMKYHTDQSLDLQEDSYICLFSCYDRVSPDLRKLKIKEKETNICSEIILEYNSCVLFSTSTNQKHVHKIVLEKSTNDTRWLGITFRLSKTLIRFVDERPYFLSSGSELRLATDKEKKQFIQYKGMENSTTDFIYPELEYTLSPADLIVPL